MNIWGRARRNLQWWVLRRANRTFLVGVSVLVHERDGRVLALRHRFWRGNPWGLPSGLLETDETVEAAAARELADETGLTATGVRVAEVRSGFSGRIEVLLTARLDGEPEPVRLQRREITAHRWLAPAAAIALVRAEHAEFIRQVTAAGR